MFSSLYLATFELFGRFLLDNVYWLAIGLLALISILLLMLVVTQCQVWRAEKPRKSLRTAHGWRWRVRT